MAVKSISHFQASAALQLAQAKLPQVRPMGRRSLPCLSLLPASCRGGPCPSGTSLLYPARACLRAGREAVSFVSGRAALLWQNTKLAGEVVSCHAVLPQSSAPLCLEGHLPAQHQGDVLMLTRPPHTQHKAFRSCFGAAQPLGSPSASSAYVLAWIQALGVWQTTPVRNTGNRP